MSYKAHTGMRQAKRLKMVPINHKSGRLISAGRALIGMTQKDLASSANISVSTLKRFEADGMLGEPSNNWNAVIAALEAAGVEFIAENGGGAGVRLKS